MVPNENFFYRCLVEKSLTAIRVKIHQKKTPIVSLEEVYLQIPSENQNEFKIFQNPKFIKNFAKAIEVLLKRTTIKFTLILLEKYSA